MNAHENETEILIFIRVSQRRDGEKISRSAGFVICPGVVSVFVTPLFEKSPV